MWILPPQPTDRTAKCSWGKGMGKGKVLGFLHQIEKVCFLLPHGMFWDFRTSLGNYLLGVSTASSAWAILFFFMSEKACLGAFSGQWNNSSFTASEFSNATVVCLFLLPWNFWDSSFVLNPKKAQTTVLICSMISVLNQWYCRVSKGMTSPGKDIKTQ